MAEHPVAGERILLRIPELAAIAPDRAPRARALGRHAATRTGCAAGSIPIGSRIILACDAYDAMITDAPLPRRR